MPKTEIITDTLGRKLEIKSFGVEERCDLLEAVQGLEKFKKWFGMASLIFRCTAIDGVPLPAPRKPDDFKKNAALLREEGIHAIFKHLSLDQENEVDKQKYIETMKTIATDPQFKILVRLLKQGVPYDKAIDLSPARQMSFLVVGGELDGGKFNWSNFSWM